MLPVNCSPDISVSVSGYDAGNVTLSVSVPLDLLESIPPLLDSLSRIFSHARHRGRVVSASARVWSPEQVEARKRFCSARDSSILAVYDRFCSSGLSSRASFNATKTHFNKRGDDLTCYVVELVARRAGRLSKKGAL